MPSKGERPIIEAIRVTKQVGNKVILRDVNLRVDAGEFVALLGPNGAGKTSLLKILSLLWRPTSGEVRLNGELASERPLYLRRQLGVLSHNTYLYPNLTARENLLFYGRLYEVPRLRERVEEVIRAVGLAYALHDPVRTFSRGMQQRLAIGRAILHDPPVLLLDEPYTGLDQQAIENLNGLLQGLNQRRRTVLLVTHSFEQGMELADRLVIMARGRIVRETAARGMEAREMKEMYLRLVEGK